ncbi:hypothetical protein [Microvirga sp. VF16]|uniref:SGNH/GDSL hydrolase family protein n=1 Tax=Microvirga sp. VF16 TaxID=2807101 RepID=UPI00193DCD82|nr:hypothetical protein [Microvirga sp. VF16]QRM35400.1 hypothetical protein JO965_44390 [Microvirga sp. VF16]
MAHFFCHSTIHTTPSTEKRFLLFLQFALPASKSAPIKYSNKNASHKLCEDDWILISAVAVRTHLAGGINVRCGVELGELSIGPDLQYLQRLGKPMPPVITFSQLISHIERRTLTPEGLRRAFILDPANTTPFNPRFTINPDFVDISGLPRTAMECGNTLAIEAASAIEPEVRFEAAPMPPSIIAEGDSWFRLPRFLYPKTMADYLSESFPILNLAHWGDLLSSMYNDGRGQFVPFLSAGNIKVVMFSGGGNDILGETLERSLNLFDVGHADPQDASYYPTAFFFEQLARVMSIYTAIFDQVRFISPRTAVLVHGYDYAIPRENGIFLGVRLARRGLHPADRPELCKAIIRVMLNLFNESLAALAARYDNVRYVDLRNTIREDEWFDQELHPTATAAERMSVKLALALRKVLNVPEV